MKFRADAVVFFPESGTRDFAIQQIVGKMPLPPKQQSSRERRGFVRGVPGEIS
jgi:hypothetical protein